MRTGILIIGSLLWDNGHRGAWRESRLCVQDKVYVKAPIRYGRRSTSRGNTFTMTFGIDDTLGQAVLVPCVTGVGEVAGLVAEAEALWKAEEPFAAANSIGGPWGCVGVVFRTENTQADWLATWRNHFRSKASAIPPVDDQGILRIPWPVTTAEGRPAEVGAVLATATKAEAKRPTATEIADAWIDQRYGHERYFFENVRHGIRTAEDGLIWRRIEERAPCWLRSGEHAEAVELLRAKAAGRLTSP